MLKNFVISFLHLVAIVSCGQASDKDNSENSKRAALEDRSAQLSDSIDSTIEDLSCEQASDCKTAAWGHKACGGPSKYIIYSMLRTDEEILNELLDDLRDTHVELGRITDGVGTCDTPIAPETDCQKEECVEVAPVWEI
jgi:hypothetical protein